MAGKKTQQREFPALTMEESREMLQCCRQNHTASVRKPEAGLVPGKCPAWLKPEAKKKFLHTVKTSFDSTALTAKIAYGMKVNPLQRYGG